MPITPELIESIVKGGVAVILSVGIIVILYTVVKDDDTEQQFLRDQMSRQTEALERLVKIYSGEIPAEQP